MPHCINLRQLEAFRSVMLAGTVTQASTMMNISQPAVSRLIRHLETRAGMQLFVRRRGKLYPTPQAELLFEEIERAYVSLDRISEFIDDLELFKSGQLRLIASIPMGYTMVPLALERLRSSYPDVKISLKIIHRREFSDWIDTQQFDLAVTTFPIDYPAKSCEVFAKTNGVCVLPEGHPLAKKNIINANDIEGVSFVSFAPDTMARHNTDQIFGKKGIRRNLKMETQTSIAICELVARGLGVSIVDPFTATKFNYTGIEIRAFRPAIQYNFGFLFPLHQPLSPVARHFAKLIRECADEITTKFPCH